MPAPQRTHGPRLTGDTIALVKVTQLAERTMVVAVPIVTAVSAPPISAKVEQLHTEVTRLTELVQSLSTKGRASHSCSLSPYLEDLSLCWYHQRFGVAVRHCKPSYS